MHRRHLGGSLPRQNKGIAETTSKVGTFEIMGSVGETNDRSTRGADRAEEAITTQIYPGMTMDPACPPVHRWNSYRMSPPWPEGSPDPTMTWTLLLDEDVYIQPLSRSTTLARSAGNIPVAREPLWSRSRKRQMHAPRYPIRLLEALIVALLTAACGSGSRTAVAPQSQGIAATTSLPGGSAATSVTPSSPSATTPRVECSPAPASFGTPAHQR